MAQRAARAARRLQLSSESKTTRPDAERQHEPRSASGGLVWRIAAALAIVVAAVGLAHFLSRPGGGDEAADEAMWPSVAPREAGTTERPERAAGADADRARTDLRKLMAGILMVAADEEGDYQEPENQTSESRREFLARHFGLPFNYPQSEVPAELLPDGAEVLMVFDHPEYEGTRMVLVRMRKDIGEVLEDFQKRYTADGWEARPPEPSLRHDPAEVQDRGWLVRFRRGRFHRILFVQPRASAEETLAVVYDIRY